MKRSSTSLAPQALVVLLALSLWAVRATPALWALLAAYALAWAGLNYALAKPRPVTLPLAPAALALLIAVAVAAPVAALYRGLPALRAREGVAGAGLWLEDRLRLEASPAIAPATVFADHPQSFYVHAPAAREVTLDLGTGVATLEGTDLGHGLFRVDYDPRLDGLPEIGGGTAGPGGATLETELRLDGRPVRRSLRYVRPLAHPRWFASAPDRGLAAVASEETDEVFVVSRRGLERRLPVGDGPTATAFFGRGRKLAVAFRYQAELEVYDVDALVGGDDREVPAGGAPAPVAERVTLASFQVDLATSGDGRLLAVAVASSAGPAVHLLALPGLVPLERVPLEAEPDRIVFGPAPATLVVADRHHRSLQRWSRKDAWHLAENGEESAAKSAAAKDAWHHANVEHNSKNREGRDLDEEHRSNSKSAWHLTGELPLGRPAVTMARSGDGSWLYVAVTDYRPDGEAHRGNHFVQDQILTVDVERFAVVDRRITARRSPVQDRAGNLDRGVSPMGIAVRAGDEEGDGNGSLLVAFAGSEEVWTLAPGSATPRQVIAGYDLDLVAPHGVADLGAGYWAASSPVGGALAVYDAAGAMVEFVGVTPNDSELAAGASGSLDAQALDLRAGERAFYESTRAGISCQSCHLHADTDHSPHDIGQTPLLPTLTVRGIAGTAPYLRDGSFARVRDLNDHLAATLYRGYRRQLTGRAQLLETYVASLPRPVNPARLEPRDLARERAGVEALARGRCTMCHAFPAFTNLSQHPARALFPDYGAGLPATVRLDTPSLLASHARSHFLQDGRAGDLAAVLDEHNRANRHGDSAALAPEARAALIHLLEAL